MRRGRIDPVLEEAGASTGNLEYAFEVDGVAVLAGWTRVLGLHIQEDPRTTVQRYARDDVNSHLGLPAGTYSGFVAMTFGPVPDEKNQTLADSIALLARDGIHGSPAGFGAFVAVPHHILMVREAVEGGPRETSARVARVFGALGRSDLADFHEPLKMTVDVAFRIPEVNAVVITGWALRGANLAITTDDGASYPLHSTWHVRSDVSEAVGARYAGFVATAADLPAMPGTVTIACESPDSSAVVEASASLVEIESADPLVVARTLFGAPTHAREFIDRLDGGEGELLSRLISARNLRADRKRGSVYRVGVQPAPEVTVVIPVFRRFDLLWNQVLSWGRAGLVPWAEFVIVNDDPRIAIECAELVDQLYAVFGIPITLVTNESNLGFASSCNVGVAVGRGRTVLLLNSDAILADFNSVRRCSGLLDADPSIGILGAQISGPDDLGVHSGMTTTWLSFRNSWFNYHPRSGLPLDATGDTIREVAAVTGAVVMMRRSDYEDVGGISEEFLIGDYEDSDLCWRIRERGQRVVVSADLRATHLERTSMSTIGDDLFREKVSLFNSWIHARKWRDQLEVLSGPGGES